jgi:hypothetical protein
MNFDPDCLFYAAALIVAALAVLVILKQIR